MRRRRKRCSIPKSTILALLGEDADDGEFGSREEDVDASASGSLLEPFLQDLVFIYPRSVTQWSWKCSEGVVRRSCIGI